MRESVKKPREQLVQGQKHPGKKALHPTFTISKTLQQGNTIPNSAGTKKLKTTSMLKQRRDNFQFGGKDNLSLKLSVFFISPWLTIIRLARLIFFAISIHSWLLYVLLES